MSQEVFDKDEDKGIIFPECEHFMFIKNIAKRHKPSLLFTYSPTSPPPSPLLHQSVSKRLIQKLLQIVYWAISMIQNIINPQPFLLLTSHLRCWIRSQIKSDIITSKATFAAKKSLQFGGNVHVLIHVIDLENEEDKGNPAAGQGSCSQAVEKDPDAMRRNRYKDDDCCEAVENQ